MKVTFRHSQVIHILCLDSDCTEGRLWTLTGTRVVVRGVRHGEMTTHASPVAIAVEANRHANCEKIQ